MAPKIEKIWGTLLGPSTVERKTASTEGATKARPSIDGDPGNSSKHNQDQADREDQEQAQDREYLEKALVEFQNSETFKKAGLHMSLVEVESGFVFRLTNPNGRLVREMTAQEFVHLMKLSKGDSTPRGKILDQKF